MCSSDSCSVPVQQEVENAWGELSSDIAELIFSKLPEASICRAASVCKQWHLVTQSPTFYEFYKKNKTGNSCSTFVYSINGRRYTFEERSDGQGGFSFEPVEHCNVPTVSCSEDGDVPTTAAAGGLHLAYTGAGQTILRYKLSLVENNWRTTPEMPRYVQDPIVGVVESPLAGGGHKLIVAGGLPTFTDVEDEELNVTIYDEKTNSWGYCEPLPSQFRGFASALFMSAVVHNSRFYVYDMYSGLVLWLDVNSQRWSPVVALRPSRKVDQVCLISRSGALCLVGVQAAAQQRDIAFTVWSIDESEGTMKVGQILYATVFSNAFGAPPSTIQRWTSWFLEFSSAIIGVLLLLLLQFLINYYKASKMVYGFLERLLNCTALASWKQTLTFRLRSDRRSGARRIFP